MEPVPNLRQYAFIVGVGVLCLTGMLAVLGALLWVAVTGILACC
jgi:hypothetical protein